MTRGRVAGLCLSGVVVAIAVAIVGFTDLPGPLTTTVGSAEPLMDGVHRVGSEVTPGKWHTDGPRAVRTHGVQGQPHCWYRLWTSVNQDDQESIAQDLHDEVSGPADVTLAAPVVALETEGCTAWRLIQSPT
jgi:hypothetical protein